MKKQKEYLKQQQKERDGRITLKLEQFTKEGNEAKKEQLISKFKVL